MRRGVAFAERWRKAQRRRRSTRRARRQSPARCSIARPLFFESSYKQRDAEHRLPDIAPIFSDFPILPLSFVCSGFKANFPKPWHA
jgi:hypothetical protein